MEVNSNHQLICSNEVRLNRFNLHERLNKLAAFTHEPIPSKADFDWQFYLKYYEDLQTLSTDEEAREHWLVFGEIEGRIPNEAALEQFLEQKKAELPLDFEPERYLTLNPDLRKRFADNAYRTTDRAIEHYLTCGKQEGRLYRLQPATQSRQIFRTISEKNNTGNETHLQRLSTDRDQYNQQDHTQSQSIPRLIAFYLPQFHPIPENDQWWGKGFTEWTNVTKARPLFEGHHQPHLPTDLGFYDLRLPEAREAQAALARKYGIYGFCYYYYWFAGKRLLNRPLDDVLASQKPDFPFCICWANENWTRRWDGQESEILIAQNFSDTQNHAFAESVAPIMKDERYIRVNGLPLLIIYRADILPDARRATEQWREVFRKQGVGEVYLTVALTCFSGLLSGLTDPTQLGFDSAVQFAPHEIPAPEVSPPETIISGFSGKFYDYKAAAVNAVAANHPTAKVFLSAMPSWDNTARRKHSAHAFLNSNPQDYEFWLRGAIEKTCQRFVGDERLVFINAWNEWAEGAHLEPDQKYGHEFLISTRQALYGTHTWRTIINLLRYLPFDNYTHFYKVLAQLEKRIETMNKSLAVIQNLLSQKVAAVIELSKAETSDVIWNLDSLQKGQHVNLNSIELRGWVVGVDSRICAIDVRHNHRLINQLPVHLSRPDVASHLSRSDAQNCGFYSQVTVNEAASLQIELDLWVKLQDERYLLLGAVQLEILDIHSSHPSWNLNDEQSTLNQIKNLRIEASDERFNLLEKLEQKISQKEQWVEAGQDLLQKHSVHDFFERF
jgi:hypothetical protein